MADRTRKGAKMLQFLFLFLGLLVAFFGWFLDHGDAYQWVRHIFAPRYDPASNAYARLLTEGSLTKEDEGFSELLGVLVEQALIPVVQIENLAPVAGLTSQGLQVGRSLRFVLQDARHVDKAIDSGWVELRLKERYLTRPLLGWAQLFMLSGLAITFGTGLYAILRQPSTAS
jgi:hypothetical protein